MKLKNNKFKIKNKNIVSRKFDISNYEIEDFLKGWAVIKDNKTKKYGWISKDYKEIIKPQFDECYDFEKRFGIFEKDGKQGWIDKNGKILAEGFDYCYNFSEGMGSFTKNDKHGFLNNLGEIIVDDLDFCSNFSEGFIVFRTGYKYGWINQAKYY